MKKIAISTLIAASTVALTSCGEAPVNAPVSQDAPTNSTTPTSSVVTGETVVKIDREYKHPGGLQKLQGDITVDANGVITNVNMINPKGFVEKFAKWINEAVVGKKLAGLKIDTVSGASLTTTAFNEAVAGL